jgi:phosphatidylglycerol:prolipoprotein diacylglycerol transferase
LIESLWYDFRVITQPLIGGFVTPYAIILSFSVVLGLGLSLWLYREDKIYLLNAGLAILFVSLIGARAGYVLRNFSYFIDNPLDMPQLWLGGLSWPGALIGAIISLGVIHLIWKEPLGMLAEGLLPLLGLLVLAIWLTGWGAGIAYGPRTDAWYGIPVRDSLGLTARRWPLPLLGALTSGAWVAGSILYPLTRGHKPGFRAVLAVSGLSGINLIISLFRVDPAPLLVGLRWESWFSILYFLSGMVVLFLLKDRTAHG